MIPRLAAIALCFIMVGCGDSPTAPTAISGGGFPDIAGTYSGPMTVTVTGATGYDAMRGTSTLTITVTQSGSEVTVSMTQTWPGESPEILWDSVRGTVDAIGILTLPPARDTSSVRCGRVRYVRDSFQFSAGSFSISMVADTDRCGRFEYRGTLTRL